DAAAAAGRSGRTAAAGPRADLSGVVEQGDLTRREHPPVGAQLVDGPVQDAVGDGARLGAGDLRDQEVWVAGTDVGAGARRGDRAVDIEGLLADAGAAAVRVV